MFCGSNAAPVVLRRIHVASLLQYVYFALIICVFSFSKDTCLLKIMSVMVIKINSYVNIFKKAFYYDLGFFPSSLGFFFRLSRFFLKVRVAALTLTPMWAKQQGTAWLY